MVTIKNIYVCECCGEEYNTLEKAEACEKIPIGHPIFTVGDNVRVKCGDGKGEIVEIAEIGYIKPSFFGMRLAHKILYTVEFDDGSFRGLIEGVDCEAV